MATNDVAIFEGNSPGDSITSVQCTSTHLTSFAVLVDVAGGLKVYHIYLDVVIPSHFYNHRLLKNLNAQHFKSYRMLVV